jgi:hypothetical protein
MMQIGDALHATGKSAEAEKWFRAFRSINPSDSRSNHKINSIKERAKIFRDSLSYIISNSPVNTEYSEFSPSIYGSNFIFLSDRPVYKLIQHTTNASGDFLEMYKCGILDLKKEPEIFNEKLSSKFHEGPYCFIKKGKQIIFTRSDEKSKKLSLVYAEFKNNNWGTIKKLPFNNSEYSLSHPCFSEEDSCLYFVSDQPGGIGGTDVYKCRLKNGIWGTPLNVGPSINTEGNEMFPYVRNGTLYFASDGLMGLGGMDIYAYELDGRKMIRNLGYPINSGADDFGIYFKKNDQGYFCSNRDGGKGKDDIYEFKNIVQPTRLKISETFNNAGIPNVKITLTESEESELFYSSAKGEWADGLKPGKEYKLKFESPGYKTNDTILLIPIAPKKELQFQVKMERRNKVFIRGIARNHKAKPIPNCSVTIVNLENSDLEKTLSNNEGEFFAEVDPDFNYTIVVENDSLLGWSDVRNLPKKRGAFVTVIDVISNPYRKQTLEILVKDTLTGENLEEAELEVKNLTTGEIILLQTDREGRCALEVYNQFEYAIRAYCNDRESGFLKVNHLKSDSSHVILMK